MGEGLGGGDKIVMESTSFLFTLPLIPSRQGRGIELLESLYGHFSQAGVFNRKLFKFIQFCIKPR